MFLRRILLAIVVIALAAFYVAGATEHGKRVNTSKARGDQSGYLWDAENVYANLHGRQPPTLIGERNRMPLYAGFLALAYRPTISDPQFFEIGKQWNIYLSLGLLAMLALIVRRWLPGHAVANLLLVTAFGSFIFKAGYTQSELLFYSLFFAAFLLLFELIDRPLDLRSTVVRAAAAGAVAALAHLTKAAMLPIVGIAVAVLAAKGIWALRQTRDDGRRLLAAAVLVVTSFLAVLSPYLLENKRTFGQYFYNVNTTFYIWYDDWPQASGGTILHGDGVGWPTLPAEELPSAKRYWKEHSVGVIAKRIGDGFADMATRSYKTFRYLPYFIGYAIFAIGLMARRRAEAAALIKRHAWTTAFVSLYAVVYAFGIAFYAPISGTGTTRFLMAHLLPAFFLMSMLIVRPWSGDATHGARFQGLVSLWLAFDIVFIIWPRLMSTYGGF